MTLGFYQCHLCPQGTTVSYFDYCYFNQTILGNKSIMIYDKNDSRNNQLVIDKFKKADIELIALDGSENMPELSNVVDKLNVDAMYIQTTGVNNKQRWVDNKLVFIHVVGMNNDPHGLVYAYVSEWSSLHCSNGQHPFVPYMAHLPDSNDDYRTLLNIPKNAIVFGRTGGYYSWNIPWVNDIIQECLNKKSDIYFLFVQTPINIKHDRIKHVEPFSDLLVKRKFINTCDAFLHARMEGESFGMAVAEFSICNKPVITYKNSPERNHIFTLGDKGIYYENPTDLKNILLNFNKEPEKDWNGYKDFSPEKVIQKFNDVFIKKL